MTFASTFELSHETEKNMRIYIINLSTIFVVALHHDAFPTSSRVFYIWFILESSVKPTMLRLSNFDWSFKFQLWIKYKSVRSPDRFSTASISLISELSNIKSLSFSSDKSVDKQHTVIRSMFTERHHESL